MATTNHISTKWLGNIAFESNNTSGRTFKIDAGPEDGGDGDGLSRVKWIQTKEDKIFKLLNVLASNTYFLNYTSTKYYLKRPSFFWRSKFSNLREVHIDQHVPVGSLWR